MIKYFILFFLNLLITLKVFTQQETSLRVPSTPAFSILNFEPSSLLKPGSLKDLGGDILNSFDEEGKLRLNIGMELSPYWLKSRPYLTNQQYNNPGLGQTILQSLNISAATVKDSVTNADKLGFGVRFQLKNGKPNPEYVEKEKELVQLLTVQAVATAGRALADSFNNIEEAKEFMLENLDDRSIILTSEKRLALKKMATDLAVQFADTVTSIQAYFETLNDNLGIESGPVASKVYELSRKRVGFFLEVAGATGFSKSDNERSLERAGIWLTASEYFSPSDAWHINLRYQFSNRDTSQKNFDAGFSYTKELSRFSLGAEGMFRWYRASIADINLNNQPILRLDKDFTYRLALQSSYLISEGISINLSVGKDFDSPYFEREGFFSIFGFNYTLFRKVAVPVQQPSQ